VVAGILMASGIVFSAGAAQATSAPTPISASGFTLSSNYSKYGTLYSQLSAALPVRNVGDVMDTATTNRVPLCDTAALSDLTDLVGGFCFADTDNSDCHNTPQGISSTRDAVGGTYDGGKFGGRQLVAVSWYYVATCADDTASPPIAAGPTTRSRLTLVDWDSTKPNVYRKILFVEPVTGSNGHASFRDIPMHAGGMAWYGNYLYVADTAGLRVFNMADILEVSYSQDDSTSDIGYQSDGSYQAHKYRYVLPQIGTVTSSASPSLAWSTISLDRGAPGTDTAQSLVMAEYDCPSASGGVCTSNNARATRAVRFPFLAPSAGGGRFAATTTASQALQVPYYKINGVGSHNGRWWFQSSGDKKLYYWTPSAGATAYTWTNWGESLSYWEDPDSDDLLWSLREVAGGRDVFAVKQSAYNG
jgi:hypothetical protein